jgi:hypothetical protein
MKWKEVTVAYLKHYSEAFLEGHTTATKISARISGSQV